MYIYIYVCILYKYIYITYIYIYININIKDALAYIHVNCYSKLVRLSARLLMFLWGLVPLFFSPMCYIFFIIVCE